MSSIRGVVELYIHAVNTQWQHSIEAEPRVPCERMATRYCPLAIVCMHLCVIVMHLFRQLYIYIMSFILLQKVLQYIKLWSHFCLRNFTLYYLGSSHQAFVTSIV